MQYKRRATAFLFMIVCAIFLLVAALILLMTRQAHADGILPDGITCEMVREQVAEHGKVKALAWAIEHGLSIRQIYIIRRTCKV